MAKPTFTDRFTATVKAAGVYFVYSDSPLPHVSKWICIFAKYIVQIVYILIASYFSMLAA